eukprot:TRINITY_DN12095_c0_g1_i1.p1 TRINITY_DN12095_c0_g1~~TRINITY_DN12095_c0_g1_i1.p1  ORF type:complete len:810 (+),score=138.78 TRINITY_DN12095_c0_g1_i1:92-2521(+)
MPHEGQYVRIRGVQARPQGCDINGQTGKVFSVDPVKGRCGVQVGDIRVSLREACLIPFDATPPWEECRHGGPDPDMQAMMMATQFLQGAVSKTAPCVEHVRLLEPLVRRASGVVPPALVASLGVDAFIASDRSNCRTFAVSAVVLDAARQVGVDRLFREIAPGASAPSAAVRALKERLGKCATADGLVEVFGLFSHCSCIAKAREYGYVVKQEDIEGRPSEHDAVFDNPVGDVPLIPSKTAGPTGKRLAAQALQLLERPGRKESMAICKAVAALNRAEQGQQGQRGAARDKFVEAAQALAVAGMEIVDGGGVARIKASLAEGDTDTKVAVLGLLSAVQSPALAEALMAAGVGRAVCKLMKFPATEANIELADHAAGALLGIVTNLPAGTAAAALGTSTLRTVVTVAVDVLSVRLGTPEDVLRFEGAHTFCALLFAIAGEGAELAELVALVTKRGVDGDFNFPTGLCMMLVHHAHEQQAGRADPHHSQIPITCALEGLYTLSLHWDIRMATLGDTVTDESVSITEAIRDYGDFLHGYVHHQAQSKKLQAYLARLLAFSPSSAPALDPNPRPTETTVETNRRVAELAGAVQGTHRRARELRDGGAGDAERAVARSHELRKRGNAAGDWEAAYTTYCEAVAVLVGCDTEPGAAWPLVLALSNRSEALLRLGRHAEVLEDVTSAFVLIARFEGMFDATEVARIAEKLARRENECKQHLESAPHAEQTAATRRRAARRKRAREEAARRAEQADADAECPICHGSAGPLEDICGHGHFFHPACASVWREQCRKLKERDRNNTHHGPTCPTCRRPI